MLVDGLSPLVRKNDQLSMKRGPTLEYAESNSRSTASEVEKADLKRARRNVTASRNDLFRRRLLLKEQRNALHEERTNVAELEADLLSFVRQSYNNRVVSSTSSGPDFSISLGDKITALECKRDELGSLQYDYDEAEREYNMKEPDHEEEEQSLEDLVSRLLGLGDSSGDAASSTATNDMLRPTEDHAPPSPVFEPDREELAQPRPRSQSDSVLATIQERFSKANPRVDRWILHTFGCCPMDYVQLTQQRMSLGRYSDMAFDDETWAQRVYNYWQQGQEINTASNHSDESSDERLTISGTPLLLSSATSKAQYTVDNYDLVFSTSPKSQYQLIRAASLSMDLTFQSDHKTRDDSAAQYVPGNVVGLRRASSW